MPLLLLALTLAFGITLGWMFRESVTFLVWCILSITTLLLLFPVWAKKHFFSAKKSSVDYLLSHIKYDRVYLAVMIVCFVLTGAALAALAYVNTAVAWPGTPQMWTAEVQSVNKSTNKGTQADVSIVGTTHNGKTVRIFLEKNNLHPHPGQRISFRALIREPQNSGNPGEFNYRNYLLTNGISGTCWVAGEQ